jgi:hypothetical protein
MSSLKKKSKRGSGGAAEGRARIRTEVEEGRAGVGTEVVEGRAGQGSVQRQGSIE